VETATALKAAAGRMTGEAGVATAALTVGGQCAHGTNACDKQCGCGQALHLHSIRLIWGGGHDGGLDGRGVDEHLAGGNFEGEFDAVVEAFDKGQKQLEDVGGLEVRGLGIGVGVVDESGERGQVGADEVEVEEGEIFFRFNRMPLDVAEGEARLDDFVVERGDADVEGSAVEDVDVEASGEEVGLLHEEGSAGKMGVAVEAGSDAMSLVETGGDDLRMAWIYGFSHGNTPGSLSRRRALKGRERLACKVRKGGQRFA